MPPMLVLIPRLVIAASDFSTADAITEDDSPGSPVIGILQNTPVCIGTAVPLALETRQRGGTATVCGFDEYTNASTPPKKYRVQTLNGRWWDFDTNGLPCGGNCFSQDSEQYGGTYWYSATTCAETNDQIDDYGIRIANIPCDPNAMTLLPQASPPKVFNSYNPSGVVPVTTTRTQVSWDYDAAICYQPFATWWRRLQGLVTKTLSDEDTDADAIARLVAGIPWPAYAACGSPAVCGLAYWQQRAAFSFAYQETDYRVTASGLTPSKAYCVKVDMYRRVYGVGAFALYATVQTFANTDGAGNLSVTGSVLNAVGFETYADNPRTFSFP